MPEGISSGRDKVPVKNSRQMSQLGFNQDFLWYVESFFGPE